MKRIIMNANETEIMLPVLVGMYTQLTHRLGTVQNFKDTWTLEWLYIQALSNILGLELSFYNQISPI